MDDVTSWHSVLSHRISWCAIAVPHKKEKGTSNLILRQSCKTFFAFFFSIRFDCQLYTCPFYVPVTIGSKVLALSPFIWIGA